MSQDPPHNLVASLLAAGASSLATTLSNSAVGALNRLIAGTVDIPATWLAGYKERIEDDNYEQRSLRRAIIDASAKEVSSRPAIIERAVSRFVAEEERRQVNRESIAVKAIPHIDIKKSQDTVVDDEWISKFSKLSEDCSQDDAQELWARIIAGEINHAGSFSIAALRIFSELDKKTAEKFQGILEYSIGPFIPRDSLGNSGKQFSDARYLESIGLLSGVSGTYAKPLKSSEKNISRGGLTGRTGYFDIIARDIGRLSFRSIWLTDPAEQISRIVPPTNEIIVANRIIKLLDKAQIIVALFWRFDPGTRNIAAQKPEILYIDPDNDLSLDQILGAGVSESRIP